MAPEPGARVTDLLAAARLLPVLVVDRPRSAQPLAEALLAGGLALAEVTFRTPEARDVLREMAQVPGMCAGAGTVLTEAQVDAAAGAGARFVVSPGLDRSVVRRCRELELPVFPGVATATEVMAALSLGADTVKLFPAASLGGTATVAALAAPFPGLKFVPTGGIDATGAASYLRHPAVLAVGGSWMAPAALVRAGEWRQITDLTAQAVAVTETLEIPS
jgi:2-dehydro-3-deoxyphosphogluconate aldolase / (4S)-4-hydroxy-2-oxoglutarate aldolase